MWFFHLATVGVCSQSVIYLFFYVCLCGSVCVLLFVRPNQTKKVSSIMKINALGGSQWLACGTKLAAWLIWPPRTNQPQLLTHSASAATSIRLSRAAKPKRPVLWWGTVMASRPMRTPCFISASAAGLGDSWAYKVAALSGRNRNPAASRILNRVSRLRENQKQSFSVSGASSQDIHRILFCISRQQQQQSQPPCRRLNRT